MRLFLARQGYFRQGINARTRTTRRKVSTWHIWLSGGARLHDPVRLLRLLANPESPVQLIIAGKAHPKDRAGQALIHDWMNLIRQPEIRPHIAFLSDYDVLLRGRQRGGQFGTDAETEMGHDTLRRSER